MKKLLALFLVLSMMFSAAALAQEQDVLSVGILSDISVSAEKTRQAAIEHARQAHGVEMDSDALEAVEYHSLTAMQLALNAGEVDQIRLRSSTADYMISHDDRYQLQEFPYQIWESFSMMVMQNNQDIYDIMNQAIIDIKADGTMDKLIEEYITKCAQGDEPAPIEMPEFEGGSIRVAVTGDVPPMDYVSADGTPAGFNMALLKEISERTQITMDVVVMENSARATALATGRTDVIFWVRGERSCLVDPQCEGVTIADTLTGSLATESYFEDQVAFVGLK